MPNGQSAIKSFNDYQKLSKDQKEFYHFEQLAKIDFIFKEFKELDKRYAKKMVETVVYGFISIVLIAVFTAIVSGVVQAPTM